MKTCLGTNKPEPDHSRAKCRTCKAAYARAWRKTEKGKAASLKHYEQIQKTNVYEAKKAVYCAVRSGLIPRVKGLICQYCGDRAAAYDHRDYARSLDVQPVCTSCNKILGEGKNRT